MKTKDLLEEQQLKQVKEEKPIELPEGLISEEEWERRWFLYHIDGGCPI